MLCVASSFAEADLVHFIPRSPQSSSVLRDSREPWLRSFPRPLLAQLDRSTICRWTTSRPNSLRSELRVHRSCAGDGHVHSSRDSTEEWLHVLVRSPFLLPPSALTPSRRLQGRSPSSHPLPSLLLVQDSDARRPPLRASRRVLCGGRTRPRLGEQEAQQGPLARVDQRSLARQDVGMEVISSGSFGAV